MTESEHNLPAHSINYALYFESLNREIERVYELAWSARAKGFDPVTDVEIPPAHDVAARVEVTLGGPVGVAKRIRELSHGEKSREDVAFAVAKEIALGELGDRKEEVASALRILKSADSTSVLDREITEAIRIAEAVADKAVRVALAILTESITAAPIEGIASVKIRGSGNSRYLAIYLAGPIRAAGGTETAMTVLVADYVRQVLGLPAFVSTEEEIERSLEEVELYGRFANLQYPIYPDMVRTAAARLPIMLTGDPTEQFEVSGSRDLPRVEDNRVRGGMVLVLNDGVVGRAAKLLKIVKRMNIPDWDWLEDLAARTSKAASSKEEESVDKKLAPKKDYLADVIGGRPVFSHPSNRHGFRLRYGRSRNTGLAGVGVHPATMFLAREFLATGTHIRTERPGKGSIVAPVDSIEGPIVLLKDGSVRQIRTDDEARSIQNDVSRIIYLGDILVALGEFLENNHPLVPSGYCEEWWSHDLEKAWNDLSPSQIKRYLSSSGLSPADVERFIELPLSHVPTSKQALHLSVKLNIPLHPRYLYRWFAGSITEIRDLRKWILSKKRIIQSPEGNRLNLPQNKRFKKILEQLGIPHEITGKRGSIILTDCADTIMAQLGTKESFPTGAENSLVALNDCSEVILRDKLGFAIGARMGRPEKAEERKMRPPVQVLFPVGRKMATERNMEKIARSSEQNSDQVLLESYFKDDRNEEEDNEGEENEESYVDEQDVELVFMDRKDTTLELVNRSCPNCGMNTYKSRCPSCGAHTEVQKWCSQEGCGLPVDDSSEQCPHKHDPNLVRSTRKINVDIRSLLEEAKEEVDEPHAYNVRAVLGLTNKLKIPEYLGKGILRAKHDVYCYRDGTARFDVTDAPLTHFKPYEVGVSVAKLREMGYLVDYKGEPLVSENQILELKVQDIIVPENGGDYLVRVGRFVDDCLEKIYGLERYYNFKSLDDVVGQLIVGLAPHTSAGIIGRIVGFTNASVCYAHPYWHAAKRRNCDGDEDAIILVLDALINFSKEYLPAGRGRFMDAPLVLSVILNPEEVDDESHNIEVCSRYPAEFYQMVAEAKHPSAAEGLVDIISSRLGSAAQYEGLSFTHDTSVIDAGPRNSKYKLLGTMAEKLEAQLELASLLDAVDAQDVAERVLSHHFIRDIRGNLRAYSTQKVQCRKCHSVYRRIPLSGTCTRKDSRGSICGESLALTVSERNISKYLAVAEKMISDHDLSEYLKQRLKLINASLDSMFVSEQTAFDNI